MPRQEGKKTLLSAVYQTKNTNSKAQNIWKFRRVQNQRAFCDAIKLARSLVDNPFR